MSPKATAAQPAAGVPRGRPIPISSGTAHLVDESDGSTTVWVGGVPSSSMRAAKDVLDFEYMQHIAAAIDAWEPPATMLALHIGAGVCTLPRYLHHRYPTSRHIAVDIDSDLPELARTWWDLPRAPSLRIRTIDGLEFLAARHPDSADVVVRDAFAGSETPVHLASSAYWEQARRVTRPSGLAIANVGVRPGSATLANEVRAAGEHFAAAVWVGDPAALRGKRIGNAVLVAGDSVPTDRLARYAASAPLPTVVRDALAH